MRPLDPELEDLYRRRHGAFQVMLASVTGSVESARDVVQEAFAEALRDQNGFRGEGSLEGWVWRIAFRVAVGSRGSRELAVDEIPEVAVTDEARDPTLAAAVRKLPPQRRIAIFLRYAGDQYVGWPPDFYMSRTKLLATDATPARFRSIVAPMAARLRQQENASGCTGR